MISKHTIDQRVVTALNHWGVHHLALVKFASNDLVYALIGITVLWFLVRKMNSRNPNRNSQAFLVGFLKDGLLLFVVPVGIAVLTSELISQIYVRERPFVAMSGVKLLVPHGVDGGMPSHHVVFMVAVAVMVYSVDRKMGYILLLVTLISGIARVSAGIHYPSDILAGAILGWIIPTIYLRVVKLKLF